MLEKCFKMLQKIAYSAPDSIDSNSCYLEISIGSYLSDFKTDFDQFHCLDQENIPSPKLENSNENQFQKSREPISKIIANNCK